MISEDFKNVDGDGEIKQMADEISTHVDSLVWAGHPDPVAFLDSAAQASPEPEIENLFRKYIAISYYFSEYRKNYALAETYADSTLQLFEKKQNDSDYDILHLYALLKKGETQQHQHLYGTAIRYFVQGWQMINPETAPCIAAKYLCRLGSISYEQENYRKSIDFYSRSWRLSADCSAHSDFSWFRRTFNHYHHLASNYRELQMPDSALYYDEWALALLEEAESSGRFSENANHRHYLKQAKGVAYGNMGTSNKEFGREEEAERFWKKSIAINERSGYANEHAELTRLRLAEYYVNAGRLKEAKTELEQTREWLDEVSSEKVELSWWRVRWKWLARAGNEAQEYAAYRQYMELQESKLQNKVDTGATDIAAQIRLSEQQHEIGRLQRESELGEMYLLMAVIVSLLTIVILFLIWRNWSQSKKNVQELADLSKQVFNQKLQLEKSNKTITRIMNMVVHDLRNPLTGIKGISSMLRSDEKLADEHKKMIGLIHDSSNHAMELINELMDSNILEELENGYKSKKKERTEMRPFLKRCVDVLQFRAREKGQTIELDFEGDATVSLNRDAMQRVIGNLISNAIKFSHRDSTIRLSMEHSTETVLLSVQDNGIGIPNDLKEEVFDMFTEAKRQGTSGEQSFGLGLSISKQIVNAHGGSIWLESEEEKGTTVYIELPLISQDSKVQ
ncbi:sensor histidine kinase [Fodinibius roseus]|nr:tetratricopeptide repeat-containing sensor histidine kinase [Fodinibius roseus]